MSEKYLGIGKVLNNSSVSVINNNDEIEISLTERLSRKKNDGTWPYLALKSIDIKNAKVAENRDIVTPQFFEECLNERMPFFEFIKKLKLEDYLSSSGNNSYITHHLAHLFTALYLCKNDKAIIVVMDGGGTHSSVFKENTLIDGESLFLGGTNEHEEFSVYLKDGDSIKCVDKQWQEYKVSSIDREYSYSFGAGNFYEVIAEYIFGNRLDTGKVMGLAPFGVAKDVSSPYEFMESLPQDSMYKPSENWSEVFEERGYPDIAATAQKYFEDKYIGRILELGRKYPSYKNLIITGGCALNCTSNYKLYKSKLFNSIYIPPYPGDSGISLGLANYLRFNETGELSTNKEVSTLSYVGPFSSIPNDDQILELFKDYTIKKSDNVAKEVAKLLNLNHVIAWFQGRSECGPRSLGNRSILASLKYPSLKNYLNENIKFREGFRPYGASCLIESASEYFDVEDSFESYYMSFAVDVRPQFYETFKEVMHVDKTSRIQTVSHSQNSRFYDLIKEYGKESGVNCLLNTSLNIMGEPIVESLLDLKNFFDKSKISYLCVGDFIIEK